MKTPEEIKRGLHVCSDNNENCFSCPYEKVTFCDDEMHVDALSYIKQLEREKRNLEEMLRNAKRHIERIG